VVGDEHELGRRLARKPAYGHKQAYERVGGRQARGGRDTRGFERRRVEVGARRRA
jgi:hypothetical protein